jgi:hypothetical protein
VISINDIYDKNLCFLIGSGASSGLFPTLKVPINNNAGQEQTIETIANYFEEEDKEGLRTLTFMYYYQECIKRICDFYDDYCIFGIEKEKEQILSEYSAFLKTILELLKHKQAGDKVCHIFTTNYDDCIIQEADKMLRENTSQFVINDGASGFSERYLDVRNFDRTTYEVGIFQRNIKREIPQINVLHLHGSLNWSKEKNSIKIDYNKEHSDTIKELDKILLEGKTRSLLSSFSQEIKDENKALENLSDFDLDTNTSEKFWKNYRKLPIVNPTIWKFHETLFEEHYYQMLRYLSYNLEKEHTVLITFGFSFADKHIRELIKRSLSSPTLKLFVCCFNKQEENRLKELISSPSNLEFISFDNANLNFSVFNKKVLTTEKQKELGSQDINQGVLDDEA